MFSIIGKLSKGGKGSLLGTVKHQVSPRVLVQVGTNIPVRKLCDNSSIRLNWVSSSRKQLVLTQHLLLTP